ncbi:cyclodeaminase/cyclohydrolase family protein [Haloimpatiens lingqiaonensis]|uniref:cyclodeaminase/cyclohydrolase family protein n=1 Tax=Haloimpatiens lingqiaonensis TaxID=1380675 RepID=UPI0010FDF6D4|nr:cyclodeaminase/cyclohydrolase family protein [Haloimpatiens lingqiaonensis]
MELKDFIEELSSNSPAPGGGSISALCGSLANGLGSMVFNLTIGKKMFNNYEKEIQDTIMESLKKVSVQKDEFLKLMDKDTEAFMKVMAAFKLPKDTDENKKIRNEKIQEAYKEAVLVPLEVAEKALATYEHILIACKYGNKNAITDAGVACLSASTSVQGAILNVKINLSSIENDDYRNKVKNRCDEILKESQAKREEIMKIVNDIVES